MMGMISGMSPSPLGSLMALGLTDKQIGKIIDLHAGFLKRQAPLLRQRGELLSDLQALQAVEAPNPADVKRLMVQIAGVDADLQVNQVKARKQAEKLLTSDQLAKLGERPLPLFSGFNRPMCGKMMGGGMMGGTAGSGDHESHHRGR